MRRGVICCRYAGFMTPSRFVEVVSTATAQAFGVYPRKGVIAPGSDADVILFDPRARHVISARTHHSRIDTNIYQGMEIEGKVRHLQSSKARNNALCSPTHWSAQKSCCCQQQEWTRACSFSRVKRQCT